MQRAPRILVVSRKPSALAAVCERLDLAGLRTITAGSAAAAHVAADDLRVEAILVDLGDGRLDEARRLTAALRRQGEARPLVAVLAPDESMAIPDGVFDLVIRRPCHPLQVCVRMQEALRLGVQAAEARLRRRTLAEMGVALPPEPAEDRQRLAVLFVGPADPAFMHLRSALAAADVDVVAAFTSFTAFDYLHDRVFHAVVLGALQSNEPAFTICSAMRRNARLLHVPALLLVDPTKFDAMDEAFARGVSDILHETAPAAETRDRIVGLAMERRQGLAVRAAFDQVPDPAVLDRPTGTFNRNVFAAHLRRMADWSAQTGKPLSLAVIRAQPSVFSKRQPGAAALHSARRQFGQMLRHLTRSEDFAARLDAGVYVAAMPATGLEEAIDAAERIRSAAECAAYDGGGSDGGVRLSLHFSCAELEPDETAPRLLKRAIDGLSLMRIADRESAAF